MKIPVPAEGGLAGCGVRQRHGAGRAGRRPSSPQHSPWAVPLGFRGCWNVNGDVRGVERAV